MPTEHNNDMAKQVGMDKGKNDVVRDVYDAEHGTYKGQEPMVHDGPVNKQIAPPFKLGT